MNKITKRMEAEAWIHGRDPQLSEGGTWGAGGKNGDGIKQKKKKKYIYNTYTQATVK